MTMLICVLLPLLIVALLVAAIIATIVQHAGRMKELCVYGVETSGTVERNELLTESRGGSVKVVSQRSSARRTLAYRYANGTGGTHSGSFDFPASDSEAFAGLAAGDPIPVVYSSRNPGVSAPKHLVEKFRPLYGKVRHVPPVGEGGGPQPPAGDAIRAVDPDKKRLEARRSRGPSLPDRLSGHLFGNAARSLSVASPVTSDSRARRTPVRHLTRRLNVMTVAADVAEAAPDDTSSHPSLPRWFRSLTLCAAAESAFPAGALSFSARSAHPPASTSPAAVTHRAVAFASAAMPPPAPPRPRSPPLPPPPGPPPGLNNGFAPPFATVRAVKWTSPYSHRSGFDPGSGSALRAQAANAAKNTAAVRRIAPPSRLRPCGADPGVSGTPAGVGRPAQAPGGGPSYSDVTPPAGAAGIVAAFALLTRSLTCAYC